MRVDNSTSSGGKISLSLIFNNMEVCCVFSLESPHEAILMGTHNIPFSIKKKRKITLSYSKSAAKGFFLGTQERVRNSRGKRAISVRAIEVLLYFTTYRAIWPLKDYSFRNTFSERVETLVLKRFVAQGRNRMSLVECQC